MTKRSGLAAALIACYVFIGGVLFVAGGWKILLFLAVFIGAGKLLWRFPWFRKGVRMQSPSNVEQTATILEYRHALEEVVAPHDGQCSECKKVAQSALDRLNRKDFVEQVLEG